MTDCSIDNFGEDIEPLDGRDEVYDVSLRVKGELIGANLNHLDEYWQERLESSTRYSIRTKPQFEAVIKCKVTSYSYEQATKTLEEYFYHAYMRNSNLSKSSIKISSVQEYRSTEWFYEWLDSLPCWIRWIPKTIIWIIRLILGLVSILIMFSFVKCLAGG
jgi:hypothetical protein